MDENQSINQSSDMRKFKSALKKFLLEGSFYTIHEYFDWNLLSNPTTENLLVINVCWYCSFNNYLFIVLLLLSVKSICAYKYLTVLLLFFF